MASEDRRRQLPWVALGLTVSLTAAIIFALWASSLSSRTSVAVAAREIFTGSTVEIDDLRAVEVASGQGARFVPMADLESVVGRTVRSYIPKGAILHPALLSTSSPISQGTAVVGAVLKPGEYPIAHLSPGQLVGAVFTSDNRDLNIAAVSSQATHAEPTAASTPFIRAEISEVSEALHSGHEALFVSLLVSDDDAVPIGKAAAANELRLILLPEAFRTTNRPLSHESPDTGAQR